MTLTIEEAIARVPMWQNADDIQVSPLEGGITNHNYRVHVKGESFHVRIAGENTEMLGIDRENEYAAHLHASRAGIAPEVVYFIRPEGYLVTRFVPGRYILAEELRQPENLQRLAEILRRIHSMPAIPGVFNAFQVVRDYTDIASRYKVPFPDNFNWLIKQMDSAEAALSSNPLTPKPCHNDLLNGNFLLTDWLYILDWEYAGMGDIFFDLANFSNNHDLTSEQDHLLLEWYFGEVTPQNFAHMNIMKMMSDFREAMWGQVQIGVSSLDFDFHAYAERHFERLTRNLQALNWERWLRDVQS